MKQIFPVRPLSEQMLQYCQLDPKEYISVKFRLKFESFHSRKCVRKCRLWNGGYILVLNVLKTRTFDFKAANLWNNYFIGQYTLPEKLWNIWKAEIFHNFSGSAYWPIKNGNVRIWQFGCLKMAWHQPQPSIMI